MTRLEGQNAKKVNNPIFNYSNVNCSQNRKLLKCYNKVVTEVANKI